jgi:putative transposase
MVLPGLPPHVTQRGNRREAIFFEEGDQQIYCDMLAEQSRKSTVEYGPTASCPIMSI